jgi:hypothetical protein
MPAGDARRLVSELRAGDAASSAAGKIEQAARLGASNRVELARLEKDAVLDVLGRLAQAPDFLRSLRRLQHELKRSGVG